jgi:hypothetical protein
MAWLKSSLVLALAGVWVLVGCSSSPSSPDVEMTVPDSPSSSLSAGQGAANRGNGDLGTVFVESQGLYYDTFVPVNELPPKGKFQQLYPGDPYSTTQYGPGDPGYRGGRWWVDVNNNEEMDEGDNYLLCPLLPPGRANP